MQYAHLVITMQRLSIHCVRTVQSAEKCRGAGALAGNMHIIRLCIIRLGVPRLITHSNSGKYNLRLSNVKDFCCLMLRSIRQRLTSLRALGEPCKGQSLVLRRVCPREPVRQIPLALDIGFAGFQAAAPVVRRDARPIYAHIHLHTPCLWAKAREVWVEIDCILSILCSRMQGNMTRVRRSTHRRMRRGRPVPWKAASTAAAALQCSGRRRRQGH
jgi:hypothetical protein